MEATEEKPSEIKFHATFHFPFEGTDFRSRGVEMSQKFRGRTPVNSHADVKDEGRMKYVISKS